ncbi:MAG: hypothetical protein LBI04_11885 [Treponema sp.]|jgi:glucosamine 6-phosphate synthetase-like amidotransferase/phosphosugar isomerase protein|nr:hypothetical protein [Treponema sp.]
MKPKNFKKYSKPRTAQYAAAVMCFIFFSLSSRAVYSQDFSSIDTDLQALENLINDTIANTQEQQTLLEDLKRNLEESGNLTPL